MTDTQPTTPTDWILGIPLALLVCAVIYAPFVILGGLGLWKVWEVLT